jgi:putative peptide zinc metalloprotease protein
MYRILVAAGIILFVAGKWFLLGCLTAVIFIYTWLIKPVSSYLKYLISNPKLRFRRKRVAALSVALIAAAIAGVGYVPFYHSIRAPGVMKSDGATPLYSPLEGVLAEVYVADGQRVEKGDPIARIDTGDLVLNIERYHRQIEEVDALIVQAMRDNIADLKPLREKRRSILEKIISASAKREAALIRAETGGVFASPDLHLKTNTWVEHRQLLGRIIADAGFRFVAAVTQNQAFDLFSAPELRAEVRLPGQAAVPIQTTDLKVIPYEQDTLPAASLSWRVGGDIPTKEDDETGTRTKESFFKVTAKMAHPPAVALPLFYHDRRGEMRIELAPASLGRQFYKSLKQLLQKRYRL